MSCIALKNKHSEVRKVKLVSYIHKLGWYRMGCIIDEKVADLQEGLANTFRTNGDVDRIRWIEDILPADPDKFYSRGKKTMEMAWQAYDYMVRHKQETALLAMDELTLGPPIHHPSKIICVGKNYADHAEEMNGEIPELPVLFSKFSNALIGPEDRIEKSPHTNKLDYEVELAVMIGETASKITKQEALDYVAGYTIANDTSARDMQKRTPQWLQGKSHDRSTPIGPWLVTPDEVVDPHNLTIRSYVNGEKRQDSVTSKLIFDIPYLLEFITSFMTLVPGDIILTGTPDGVAAGMRQPVFLQAGDQVALEIETIGKMENSIADQNQMERF